jgi:hypothetical protein
MEESKNFDIESLASSLLKSYSKERLIALLVFYTRLYMLLDGHWYLSVKQRFGDKQAIDIDLQVWDKQEQKEKVWDKQEQKEIIGLAELMDFQKRDVVSLMELSAIMPSAAGSKGYIEVKNRNDCTLNITHCPIFRTLVKEGEGREKTECEVICRRLMTNMAIIFNPSIKVEPAKLPTHRDQDEVYCQWRFKLEGSQ